MNILFWPASFSPEMQELTQAYEALRETMIYRSPLPTYDKRQVHLEQLHSAVARQDQSSVDALLPVLRADGIATLLNQAAAQVTGRETLAGMHRLRRAIDAVNASLLAPHCVSHPAEQNIARANIIAAVQLMKEADNAITLRNSRAPEVLPNGAHEALLEELIAALEELATIRR